VRLTPKQIALTQLERALDLYLSGSDLVSAITLAGAAEEILGKLVRRLDKTPSLELRAERKRRTFRALWPNRPDPGTKPFIKLANQSRNAMKHLITTEPIEVDLNLEAGKLLARAVDNYSLLFGRETPKMRTFQRKRLAAYRFQGVS
jgi:hypothetical protein